MPLRFAIHGHCLVCKVKQRHWLGEATFVVWVVSHSSRYTLQTITTIYLTLSKLCPKYCRSLFSPDTACDTAFFNDVTITSSSRSAVQVLMGHFTIFQSHGLSGWSVPKIVKSCQNLSKLWPKYYRSIFFLEHFGDDCTIQSLDWCKKPLLAAASNKYITTTKWQHRNLNNNYWKLPT